jgi:hydroxymethylglutaryl-CoA reductase
MPSIISGFSKLSQQDKINALVQDLHLDQNTTLLLNNFRIEEPELQNILNELSENTITNFPSPYGIAPNFRINDKIYHIPFVTEESSVVAAASKAAKIWAERGGFQASVKSTIKKGQVHFIWHGKADKLKQVFPYLEKQLRDVTSLLTESMRNRGGGIRDIAIVDKTKHIPGYYQLQVDFNTVDAMGANFINSCLEAISRYFTKFVSENPIFTEDERSVEILMSILSNYNPECTVEAYVECPIDELEGLEQGYTAKDYVRRFKLAVDIAKTDIYRATTHNKGIFNGIDAVAIATGNDYRAIEAGAHVFASRNGHYQSLSSVSVHDGLFRFSIEIPLAVGTIGGITTIHPLAKLSLLLLGQPSAEELMMIMASAGLASNFSAIHALTTTGIQKGHMKMHLSNILNQLKAGTGQKKAALTYFSDREVSFSEVERFLSEQAGVSQESYEIKNNGFS